MSIDDRINAVTEAEKARIDAVNRKVTVSGEVRRRRAGEHRTRAEALMPEVSEGVRLLRSKRERSAQLLEDLGTPTPMMRLVWRLGSGWTEKRRRERREMIGWEMTTGSSEPHSAGGIRKVFPAYRVFIPFQGALRVQGVAHGAPEDTWETLDGHVRAGIVDVPVTQDKVIMTAEVHADITVSRFLDILAKHLALLDQGLQ